MSHVSENAMTASGEHNRVMREFSGEIKRERGKPSEAAAYYMLDSPAVHELLREARRISADRELPPEPLNLIRMAVVGKQISNEVPLLHELISGPFDADKLDYMTRDACMTGVPVVTDIPRLVQKVRGRRLPLEKLPSEVKSLVDEDDDGYVLTGISLSGGRTLDELMLGQTLLFDKLYRHQKVRASEAMVASVYDQIAPLCKDGELMAPYALVDAELLHLCREALERFAGRELVGEEDQRRAAVAEDICGRLVDRRLFRRAYAFAQNMPLDPYRMDRDHDLGLKTLVSDGRGASKREALVSSIVEQTYIVLEGLGRGEVCDLYPGGDIHPYVRLDPPKAAAQGNDTARAYLINDSQNGPSVIRFKDDYAETTGWSNAYLLTRDIGYVFTTEELALPVFLAAEKVARVEYDVRTPLSMLAYAKHDQGKLNEAKRTLEGVGFYDGTAFDVRPPPPRFEKGDYRDRVNAVGRSFLGYQGPVLEGQEDKEGTVMSPDRIETWVRQFGSEHADVALTLAERIHMIGRNSIVKAVRGFLETETGEPFSGGSLTPLGDAKDSSALTTYYAGDIGALSIRNLSEALREEKPIVFAEDFVGSGAQTITILEQWLGRKPRYDLHEEREGPLSPLLQKALKDRPLALVYAAGQPEGAENVKKVAAEIGLEIVVHLQNSCAPVAFAEGNGGGFEARCREIGEALLRDENPEHDDDWIVKRALGYGNKGFLVVLPYNTPTQALTCLWKGGQVDGVPWVPLVPRRPKA